MKIVAPVMSTEEVQVLSRAGARELYCGFVPDAWLERFGGLNANRRPSGNFRSHAELEQAIQIAHRNDCSMSLVLNAQSYTNDQLTALVTMAESFRDMGGNALIVSDLGLIGELAGHVPSLRIHVSSVATCRNSSAARLCRELGASRLILPRDITICEACEISAETPDLEIETFILNDGCIFEEGACATLHLPRNLGGPICMDNFVNHYSRRGGGSLKESLIDKLQENDREYRQWLWYRFSCGFTTTETGMPFGPCGLCALPALLEGRITAVKIAGREAPLARKLASVKMVRSVMDRVEAGDDPEQVMRFAQELRPSIEGCSKGYMCYYPEVLRR
ncbi:U32 family peptidase [Pseudomonas schmalbachii]|uniref:U32 family peptidase n=1 Tax=Pseudomonas schmalbachii TaxID=2816993 RepID=A0ABS3TM16_9PSED|nr:U32 family peptidase [Pseudomonas schmalbachii]MBO3273629.1 U32 family peptidase [Pseudomonas schmalbachii]